MKREFDAKVRKVGNSYVVTIPSSIIKRFNLKEDKFITVSVDIEENKKREFDAKIRKVGNSFVTTIPSSIIKRYDLKEDKFITVSVELEEDKE